MVLQPTCKPLYLKKDANLVHDDVWMGEGKHVELDEQVCLYVIKTLYGRKFSPPALIGTICITRIFLLCINGCTEVMATYTTLMQIYFTEPFL